ncbi:MAG: regulatory iron-sulfur-containing complex subunit RicT [Marinilabiliaceae bacterium]|jgi:cell fate regulator YaaT (PSP1 superfamily)|nr:regulatory iron-sulfur-containing complex subunit RicT [Marinilabiliaceae bacterium]
MESEIKSNSEQDQNNITDTKYIPGHHKLNSFNWLADIPSDGRDNEVVEVRFKNTRKGFFRNVNNLRLDIDDVVAVEASPGHDIGRVSMIGRLVDIQMKHQRNTILNEDMKKIYRKAKDVDIEKWEAARSLEVSTMLESRKIAEDLGLNMKIGDVEYQGDKTKAIFYYIADERVDFRQLIKQLADKFRVRIEMRQIGARQEAGRIGGIGSCGRELCCSSYMKNFVSVTTAHARIQDLSLNPQKLAGQCGKLKCCLNYEIDSYAERQSTYPRKDIPLETADGTAHFVKMEIYKGVYWYSYDRSSLTNLTAVTVDRVREVQQMNRQGKKPTKLSEDNFEIKAEHTFENTAGKESLTRFSDKGKGQKQDRNRNKRKKRRNDKRK